MRVKRLGLDYTVGIDWQVLVCWKGWCMVVLWRIFVGTPEQGGEVRGLMNDILSNGGVRKELSEDAAQAHAQ